MVTFTGDGPSTLVLAIVGIVCLLCYEGMRKLRAWVIAHRLELESMVAENPVILQPIAQPAAWDNGEWSGLAAG